MKNKCLDCPDRYPGCHGECESYKKFRDELDKMNEHKKKMKEIEYYPTGDRFNRYNK